MSSAKAFLAAFAAVACFSAEAAFARAIGPGIDVGTIALLRGLSQIAFVVVVFRIGVAAALATDRPRMHVARGFLTVVGGVTYFLAFASLPLAVATVILFTGVMFTTLGAQAFLGEKVGWRRWSATIAGFVGVVIVARPGAIPLDFAFAMAILTAINAACINLATKGLTRTESTPTIMVWIGLVMLATAPAMLWFSWTWPTPAQAILMMGIAITGTLGQYSSIVALRNADISAVAPVLYVRIVVAVGLGWWLFGEAIDATTILGGAIVTLSALYITLREARLAKERAGGP
jgi:drug/metabolite transporter (DMT)-like permease